MNNPLKELNDSLSDEETTSSTENGRADPPDWAVELVEQVEANTELLDVLEEQRREAAKQLLDDVEVAVKQNRQRIAALSRATNGSTESVSPTDSSTPTERKYAEAWDDTLEVE